MMADTRIKSCGCITFEVGPPVLCVKHQVKAEQRAKRERVEEERGLRRAVTEQAEILGHELTRFKEYGSQRGKHTAYCLKCGDMCIVYDTADLAPGDQVAGHLLEQPCRRSELLAAMKETDESRLQSEMHA